MRASHGSATPPKRLVWYWLAVPLAVGVALALPERGLLTLPEPWYVLPLSVPFAHLFLAAVYALTTRSLRRARVFLRSSWWAYGKRASLLHLQAACLVALAEEALFRYALLPALAEGLESPWAAVALSSLAFALVHRQVGFHALRWWRYLELFVFGAILGLLTLWTGSIFPAILLHGLRNYILRCLIITRSEYVALVRQSIEQELG